MSAEASIYALLATLVGNRVYPDVAPADSALPRIVYQQVGGTSLMFQEGTLPDNENGRMQIACWATTRAEAVSLAQQAETMICASSAFQAEPLGARISQHEADTNLYGTRQDFSIWSPR